MVLIFLCVTVRDLFTGVCTFMNSSVNLHCHSSRATTLLLETGSLVELGPYWFGGAGWPEGMGMNCFYFPGTRIMCNFSHECWDLTQVSVLSRQAFTEPSSNPVGLISLFNINTTISSPPLTASAFTCCRTDLPGPFPELWILFEGPLLSQPPSLVNSRSHWFDGLQFCPFSGWCCLEGIVSINEKSHCPN